MGNCNSGMQRGILSEVVKVSASQATVIMSSSDDEFYDVGTFSVY